MQNISFNTPPLTEEDLFEEMNIDKFGHHIHKRLRVSEILNFEDRALLKKDSGEYDLQSSTLKGVKQPQFADEAVNKEYLDELIKNLKQDINIKIIQIFKYIDEHFNTKHDVENKLSQSDKKNKPTK